MDGPHAKEKSCYQIGRGWTDCNSQHRHGLLIGGARRQKLVAIAGPVEVEG